MDHQSFLEKPYVDYYSSCDADEEAMDWAENNYGQCVGEIDGQYVFYDSKTNTGGIGVPEYWEDADEDGCYGGFSGVEKCKAYRFKNGNIMLKTFKLIPSKRKSPVRFRGKKKQVVDKVFVFEGNNATT